MKKLIIIFLFIAKSVFASEYGIINDPDGYTNVRDGRRVNANIIWKFKEGDKFLYTPDENNSWWEVQTPDKYCPIGYVHKSKIIPYYEQDIERNCDFITDEYCKPNKIYKFSNNNEIAVGGYLLQKSKEKIKISEFKVYDCKRKKELKFYDALQNCIVFQRNDNLFIIELTNLPFGNNQEWIELPYIETKIYPKGDDFIIIPEKYILEAPKVSSGFSQKFLSSLKLKKGKGYFPKYENTAGILLLLTLNNNKYAKEILLNLEKYFGFKVDGAGAEFYHKVIRILERQKN